MITFIFKDKRYMVFSADAFGVSASHSKMLEDPKNYPYIPLKHEGIKICANRRSLALLYLRDILNDMSEISFDTLRDEAWPRLKEKLSVIGQLPKGGKLLEELFIVLKDQIYDISTSGAIVGVSSNYVYTASGIDKGAIGYINKHINDDVISITSGIDSLISDKNEIRRPPYFIVDLDNDSIERICL